LFKTRGIIFGTLVGLTFNFKMIRKVWIVLTSFNSAVKDQGKSAYYLARASTNILKGNFPRHAEISKYVLFRFKPVILTRFWPMQPQLCKDTGKVLPPPPPPTWEGSYPMQPLPPAVGLWQAQRQPITRRKPELFWTGVEGWLRQRVSDGKDNSCNEIVFIHDLSL
jgi:hypothetical protein